MRPSIKIIENKIKWKHGKSAYETAVAGGYAGTEAQFNAQIPLVEGLPLLIQNAGSAATAASQAAAAATTAAAGATTAVLSAGYLGAIAYNAAAPTPGRNGFYEFSSAGVYPAWLNPTNPVTTNVAIQDRVSVVYSAGVHSYSFVGSSDKQSKADALVENIIINDELFKNTLFLGGNIKYITNYLNLEKITTGRLWIKDAGKLAYMNTPGKITEKIKLVASIPYTFQNCRAFFSYLVDDNDNVIYQFDAEDGQKTITLTPSTTCFACVSYYDWTGLDGISIVNSDTIPSRFIPFGTYKDLKLFNSDLSKLNSLKKINVIKINTSVDILAVVRGITDSSIDNQYILEISEGEYQLHNYITPAEQQGNIWGLTLPDYVHLKGIGNVDNIKLICQLPLNSLATTVEYTSTINLSKNNNLENITFIAMNCRYAVHDESSGAFQNYLRNVKDCKFIHYGNAVGFWKYTYAWGEGCSSGSKSIFENCIFKNNSYIAPYGFHTNSNFTKESLHRFINCKFESTYFGVATVGTIGAFKVQDLQCGQPINIEFFGCSFNGFIFLENGNSAIDWAKINILGYGNTPMAFEVYRPNVISPSSFPLYLTDIAKTVKNITGATIAKGSPLKYNNFSENTVQVCQSNGLLVDGISMEDIANNSCGQMQYKGLMKCSLYGITGFASGTKIGVLNWGLAIDEVNYFAVSKGNGLLYFL